MTELTSLNKSYQKTHEWLKQIAQNMDWSYEGEEAEEKAWKGLGTVLHAIRDALSVEQNAHIAAQLPLILKGLFYENYSPAHKLRRVHSFDEFVDIITGDINNDAIDARTVILNVFGALKGHLSEGQFNKIFAEIPSKFSKELREELDNFFA